MTTALVFLPIGLSGLAVLALALRIVERILTGRPGVAALARLAVLVLISIVGWAIAARVNSWSSVAIGAALAAAWWLLPDDDDDHRPRRRRFRSALKRAKSWLAVGIPAARVEGA